MLTSTFQAANECRTKVAAIVKECRRLNQRYRKLYMGLDTPQSHTQYPLFVIVQLLQYLQPYSTGHRQNLVTP